MSSQVPPPCRAARWAPRSLPPHFVRLVASSSAPRLAVLPDLIEILLVGEYARRNLISSGASLKMHQEEKTFDFFFPPSMKVFSNLLFYFIYFFFLQAAPGLCKKQFLPSEQVEPYVALEPRGHVFVPALPAHTCTQNKQTNKQKSGSISKSRRRRRPWRSQCPQGLFSDCFKTHPNGGAQRREGISSRS